MWLEIIGNKNQSEKKNYKYFCSASLKLLIWTIHEGYIFCILSGFFFLYIFLVGWFYSIMEVTQCSVLGQIVWILLRMPTMKATGSISSPRLFNFILYFFFLFCFIMFIKYIILFILQLTILELFEAIEFEGNFEKLSYYDHLYLAMEGGTYSFVESWMLFSWIIKIFIP